MALSAALLVAPFSTALTAHASVRAAVQQENDVPSDAEQAMFTKGQNLYNQGRYEQAVTVLQDFLKTYPRSIITDLTLLWLGRSYMQLGKLKDAEQVGMRLHAIKDTPFADIYDGELETARAEARVAQPSPTPGRPVVITPGKPVARKIPSATPTPTPAFGIAGNNTNVNPSQPKQTP